MTTPGVFDFDALECAAAAPASAPPLEFEHGPCAPPPASALRAAAAPSILRASLNVEASALTERMRDELTLVPKTADDRKPQPYEAFTVQGAVAQVPRYWGLGVFGGGRCTVRTSRGEAAPALRFGATLRPYQVAAVGHVVRALTDPATAAHGAMLVAGCGCGKTVMALAIAARLGRKTAVLCHNSMLIEQWRERIAQFFGAGSADPVVGVVQREQVEVEPPIVCFMIASVVSGRYDAECAAVFDRFGLVVVDECHHIAAKTFMQSLRRFPADARLGLTATPERRDGLGHAVEWMLGPVVYRVKRVTQEVEVRVLAHERGAATELKRYGKPDYTRMVTRTVDDVARTDALASLARRLVDEGRHVIVLSDRRAHLEALHARLGAELSGVYAGETTKKGKRERETSLAKRVMLATTKMGEEGLDVPILSALVLATPKSGLGGIEQAVGRILRKCAAKTHHPLIVDVVDPANIFRGMARKRERYYREQGFRVVHGPLEPA